MKIVLITNTKRYPMHDKVASLVCNVLKDTRECQIRKIDIGEDLPFHEKASRIQAEQPNLIITFDMVGFELRTTMERPTYNIMPFRMAHLLFEKYKEYEHLLADFMNFSMFFFGEKALCEKIQHKHPHIDNICCIEEIAMMNDEDACKIVVEKIMQVTEMDIDY